MGERFVLGGRLSFLTSSREYEDADEITSRGLGIYGVLEILLNEGGVRGFLGPLVGLESSGSTNGDVEFSQSALVIGATAGAHAFATDSFSIDPTLTLGYVTGSEELKIDDVSAGEVDYGGFVFLLGFGVSGWLGDSPRTAPAPPEAAEAYTSPSGPPASKPVITRGEAVEEKDDGTELTIHLGAVARLRLLLPLEGSSVDFALLTPAASNTENCDAITVDNDKGSTPLTIEQTRIVPRGSSLLLHTTGTVSLQALRAANRRRSDAITLTVCGREYQLSDEGRRELRQFTRKFLKEHARAETKPAALEAAPAEPTETPEAPPAEAPGPPAHLDP